MLKTNDTMRNVQLVVTTTGRIHNNHDRNSLGVVITYKARALIWVIGVELNQVCTLSQFALHLIMELINQILIVVIHSVSLHSHF
jgi:hypothetical protein